MKHFKTLLLLIFLFSYSTIHAQLTVKDQDSTPNTLFQVSDEGPSGSIWLGPISEILDDSKLYNNGGNLYWGANQLGTTYSAGGWIDDGSIIKLSSITDKVGIGTLTPSTKLHVSGIDGVLFEGTLGSGTTLNLGSGTRMMWYPKKAALRAGYIAGDGWNDANIGDYSFALGYNSVATGSYSYALGMLAAANSNYSIAIGSTVEANDWYSTAIGRSTTANGNSSMSLGNETETVANFSIAIGSYLTNNSYRSLAVGCYNIGGGSLSTWIGSDPLFEIGNGSSSSAKNNAITVLKNGKVGFGTALPRTTFEVAGSDGVLFGGVGGSGSVFNFIDSGPELLWYPRKIAFRAGFQNGSNWDDVNIGEFSTAFGHSTIASGSASYAIGILSESSGDYSIAMGDGVVASGNNSVAIGLDVNATKYADKAFGYNATASGSYSTVLGNYVQVNGEGAFFIGDHSTTTTDSKNEPNRFHARFARGYYLYTNSAADLGVYIGPGGSSWTSISDSTKKENFKLVNGEEVLGKISKFNLGSWNYIGQDPVEFRHYGPMAQDFYNAFGNDGFGTIGCDTLLSSADFDGINFIAIQALEKRTKQQQEKIDILESKIIRLEKMIDSLNVRNTKYVKLSDK